VHHKAYVNGSRVVLTMLLIAALVLLGLAVAIAVLGDPPEVGGWLRTIFGKVFGVVAVGLAAVLGVPAAVGLYAMSGANAEGVEPALPPRARQALVAVAIVAVALTAVILVVTGSAATVLNLGLFGIVALASLGLAGAVNFSSHRWRAIASAGALCLVVAGTAWVLGNAFLGSPGANLA
jgi:hypothetical protein